MSTATQAAGEAPVTGAAYLSFLSQLPFFVGVSQFLALPGFAWAGTATIAAMAAVQMRSFFMLHLTRRTPESW